MKNKIYYLLAISLAITLMAGCNSSSDGSTNVKKSATKDENPTEITKANAAEIVDAAIGSFEVIEFSGMADFYVDDLQGASSNNEAVANLAKAWTFKQLINYSNTVNTAATESFSEACPSGGSMSYTLTEKENAEGVQYEKIVASFKKCDFGLFEFIIDGSTSMEITTTPIIATAKNYEFSQTINNLSFSGKDEEGGKFSLVLNGGMQGNCTDSGPSESCTLTSDSLEISVDDYWVRIFDAEFTSSETMLKNTLTANYKINSSELAGMLHLTTPKTLNYFLNDISDFPHSGEVKVSGSSNSYVLITYGLENSGFGDESVADIKIVYANGDGCIAKNVTEDELDDGDWIGKCN